MSAERKLTQLGVCFTVIVAGVCVVRAERASAAPKAGKQAPSATAAIAIAPDSNPNRGCPAGMARAPDGGGKRPRQPRRGVPPDAGRRQAVAVTIRLRRN